LHQGLHDVKRLGVAPRRSGLAARAAEAMTAYGRTVNDVDHQTPRSSR
jgi:hypothetical protein